MLNLILWMGLGWLLLCVPSTIVMLRLFRLGSPPVNPMTSVNPMPGQLAGVRSSATGPVPWARSRADRVATTFTKPAGHLSNA